MDGLSSSENRLDDIRCQKSEREQAPDVADGDSLGLRDFRDGPGSAAHQVFEPLRTGDGGVGASKAQQAALFSVRKLGGSDSLQVRIGVPRVRATTPAWAGLRFALQCEGAAQQSVTREDRALSCVLEGRPGMDVM